MFHSLKLLARVSCGKSCWRWPSLLLLLQAHRHCLTLALLCNRLKWSFLAPARNDITLITMKFIWLIKIFKHFSLLFLRLLLPPFFIAVKCLMRLETREFKAWNAACALTRQKFSQILTLSLDGRSKLISPRMNFPSSSFLLKVMRIMFNLRRFVVVSRLRERLSLTDGKHPQQCEKWFFIQYWKLRASNSHLSKTPWLARTSLRDENNFYPTTRDVVSLALSRGWFCCLLGTLLNLTPPPPPPLESLTNERSESQEWWSLRRRRKRRAKK